MSPDNIFTFYFLSTFRAGLCPVFLNNISLLRIGPLMVVRVFHQRYLTGFLNLLKWFLSVEIIGSDNCIFKG